MGKIRRHGKKKKDVEKNKEKRREKGEEIKKEVQTSIQSKLVFFLKEKGKVKKLEKEEWKRINWNGNRRGRSKRKKGEGGGGEIYKGRIRMEKEDKNKRRG